MMERFRSSSLGLVASSKRSIRSGSEYNKYFDTSEAKRQEIELMSDGSVYDTLKLMNRMVKDYKHQTANIAKQLKGSSVKETCENVWNFCYRHIQYKKDHSKREQLRQPIRTWIDRATGVDCDCFSIFCASILSNLGIKYSFRMAAYKPNEKGVLEYQHVYVVVPSGSGYYVIDPVVHKFNYEEPYKKIHDDRNMKITMLNGLGECQTKPEIQRLRRFVQTEVVIDKGLIPTAKFLEASGVKYTQVLEGDSGVILIQTPRGVERLPTIITPTQAQAIYKSLGVKPESEITVGTQSSVTPAETEIPKAEATTKNKIPWPWLIVGALGLVLITGEDSNTLEGLSGVRKLSRKKKKRAKKMRTLHI